MDKKIIAKFFDRYQRFFMKSLAGAFDSTEAGALYAQELIAASPIGVMTAKNDESTWKILEQSHEHYRAIGTKDMRVKNIRISPIDDLHCVAHVEWSSVYTKDGKPDITIDFEVHYLMQMLNGLPKVFGWVSGNEQELLEKHGIASNFTT